MRCIPLPKGQVALVDNQDYEYLMQWKWRANSRTRYVQTDVRINGKHTTAYMHRVVARRMGLCLSKKIEVDHRNRQRNDNRRSNLRQATSHQQAGNCTLRKDNTSGFRGVRWQEREQRWQAMILIDRVGRSLGYFPATRAGKIEAARAYNKAALKYFGEFAVLNPV